MTTQNEALLKMHHAAMNALSDFVKSPGREKEQAMRKAEGEFCEGLRRLQSENEELRKDAERYRKLWEVKNFTAMKNATHALFSFDAWCEKSQGDLSIDTAIAKQKGGV